MGNSISVIVSQQMGIFQNHFRGAIQIPKKYGFTGDVGRTANPSQIVKIEARYGDNQGSFMVTGLLHKDVQLGVSSTFGAPVTPITQLDKLAKGVGVSVGQIVQMGSGNLVSSTMAWTTRRVWEATSPMEVMLDMKFVAVNSGNIRNEVVQACTRLQQLAAPTRTLAGFISPPGPNAAGIGGDNINIYVGKFLKFLNVVVTNVSVTYDNKFDKEGNPISASCQFTFQTFEMINKGELENITSIENLTQNFPSGVVQSLSTNQSTADSIAGAGLSGS